MDRIDEELLFGVNILFCSRKKKSLSDILLIFIFVTYSTVLEVRAACGIRNCPNPGQSALSASQSSAQSRAHPSMTGGRPVLP